MTRTTLTKGVWTEVATNVTSFVFNLTNTYPDSVQKSAYKIHWGGSLPAVDTEDFNYYELDGNPNDKIYALPIQFSNSTATNIYVMPVYEDGAITY